MRQYESPPLQHTEIEVKNDIQLWVRQKIWCEQSPYFGAQLEDELRKERYKIIIECVTVNQRGLYKCECSKCPA